jgi:hypothetical protein
VIDTPAPQVREHSLHGPQSLQPPWIASGRSPIVTHCWFKHHCKSSHPLLLKYCGSSCAYYLSLRNRSSFVRFQPSGGKVVSIEVMIMCQLIGHIVHVRDRVRRVESWVKLLLAGKTEILRERQICMYFCGNELRPNSW